MRNKKHKGFRKNKYISRLKRQLRERYGDKSTKIIVLIKEQNK